MPHWICCNSCFNLPGPDCQLAVASCGHVICNVCFQKGKQGECMICKAKCQVTPLSDKSSAEVKALFSDINSVATKHFTEISKVLLFQARHQKRLLVHYQNRNEKLEDVLLKMKQEIQQMSKNITAQNAYIAKLESTLQHQRAENIEVDGRGLFRKPEISGSVQKLSFISPPQDGCVINMKGDRELVSSAGRSRCLLQRTTGGGTVLDRLTNQNTLVNHSARSVTVSHLAELQMTPNLPYRRDTGWETPIFKPPSAYGHPFMSSLSMSSLGATCPPP